MHFEGMAETKKAELSDWQNYSMEYLCKLFTKKIENIIKSEEIEKIKENSYLYKIQPMFGERASVLVLFHTTQDGYYISNFEFN